MNNKKGDKEVSLIPFHGFSGELFLHVGYPLGIGWVGELFLDLGYPSGIGWVGELFLEGWNKSLVRGEGKRVWKVGLFVYHLVSLGERSRAPIMRPKRR